MSSRNESSRARVSLRPPTRGRSRRSRQARRPLAASAGDLRHLRNAWRRPATCHGLLGRAATQAELRAPSGPRCQRRGHADGQPVPRPLRRATSRSRSMLHSGPLRRPSGAHTQRSGCGSAESSPRAEPPGDPLGSARRRCAAGEATFPGFLRKRFREPAGSLRPQSCLVRAGTAPSRAPLATSARAPGSPRPARRARRAMIVVDLRELDADHVRDAAHGHGHAVQRCCRPAIVPLLCVTTTNCVSCERRPQQRQEAPDVRRRRAPRPPRRGCRRGSAAQRNTANRIASAVSVRWPPEQADRQHLAARRTRR